MNLIKWLEEWFCSNCFNDWDNYYGITVETLDNPGWSVRIDLEDTPLENKAFEEYKFDNGDDDWIVCRVENKTFEGFGDPHKLETIILKFKEFTEL